MLTLGNPRERRLAIFISCVGVDVVPLQQYIHYLLMPTPDSSRGRCSPIFIHSVVGYILPLQNNLKMLRYSTLVPHDRGVRSSLFTVSGATSSRTKSSFTMAHSLSSCPHDCRITRRISYAEFPFCPHGPQIGTAVETCKPHRITPTKLAVPIIVATG